jgi:hypothetical protein
MIIFILKLIVYIYLVYEFNLEYDKTVAALVRCVFKPLIHMDKCLSPCRL